MGETKGRSVFSASAREKSQFPARSPICELYWGWIKIIKWSQTELWPIRNLCVKSANQTWNIAWSAVIDTGRSQIRTIFLCNYWKEVSDLMRTCMIASCNEENIEKLPIFCCSIRATKSLSKKEKNGVKIFLKQFIHFFHVKSQTLGCRIRAIFLCWLAVFSALITITARGVRCPMERNGKKMLRKFLFGPRKTRKKNHVVCMAHVPISENQGLLSF